MEGGKERERNCKYSFKISPFKLKTKQNETKPQSFVHALYITKGVTSAVLLVVFLDGSYYHVQDVLKLSCLLTVLPKFWDNSIVLPLWAGTLGKNVPQCL